MMPPSPQKGSASYSGNICNMRKVTFVSLEALNVMKNMHVLGASEARGLSWRVLIVLGGVSYGGVGVSRAFAALGRFWQARRKRKATIFFSSPRFTFPPDEYPKNKTNATVKAKNKQRGLCLEPARRSWRRSSRRSVDPTTSHPARVLFHVFKGFPCMPRYCGAFWQRQLSIWLFPQHMINTMDESAQLHLQIIVCLRVGHQSQD